jgi:hypothetical protein
LASAYRCWARLTAAAEILFPERKNHLVMFEPFPHPGIDAISLTQAACLILPFMFLLRSLAHLNLPSATNHCGIPSSLGYPLKTAD